MIRSVTAILAVPLAACATVEPPIQDHGVTPGYTCSDAMLGQFVGQQATQALGTEMLRVSGSRTIRWVRPGMAVTMDFSPQRLTVHLDSAGRVERATCG